MIDVIYNKEENIIYIDRSGDVTLQDILSNIKGMEGNFKYQKELFILEDLRNSIDKYEIDDFPIIIEQIKKSIVNFKFVKSAIIVDSPDDTVFGLLFEQISKTVDNYYFKTFSTVKVAKQWLCHSNILN